MSEIGALRRDEIGKIVSMTQDYFPGSRNVSPASIEKAIHDLYFHSILSETQFPALVSRSENGEVEGFLGVRTSRYTYMGRTVVVTNCHHLMATEPARSQLVPMKLLQHFLKGPQDLSFADGAIEATRYLWERLGGVVSHADSLYFKTPLRPVSFATRNLFKSMRPTLRNRINSVSSGVDTAGRLLSIPLFHRKKPTIRMEELSADRLIEGLDKLARNYTLFPVYDSRKIDDLFSLLEHEQRFGTLQKVGLYSDRDDILGWFLYYSNKGGVCEVIQAVSLPGYESLLHDAITWHAWSRGGVELCGRLMTTQLKSPLATRSICMPGRMWTLIHSRDCEMKNSIHSGRAFLTRLEGDLWVL
ncbi:MAG: hypothetical protein WD115_02820 [Balneolaceae bacterium]